MTHTRYTKNGWEIPLKAKINTLRSTVPSIPLTAYQESYAGCNLSQYMRLCKTNKQRGHLWRLSVLTSICPPLLSTLNVSKLHRLELHGGFIRAAIIGVLKQKESPASQVFLCQLREEAVGSPKHQRRSNTSGGAPATSLDTSKL